MLSDRSQTQEDRHQALPRTRSFQKSQTRRRNVERGCQGLGERQCKLVFNGFTLGETKKVLEVETIAQQRGCTQGHRSGPSNLVQVASFMLQVFCHKKTKKRGGGQFPLSPPHLGAAQDKDKGGDTPQGAAPPRPVSPESSARHTHGPRPGPGTHGVRWGPAWGGPARGRGGGHTAPSAPFLSLPRLRTGGACARDVGYSHIEYSY